MASTPELLRGAQLGCLPARLGTPKLLRTLPQVFGKDDLRNVGWSLTSLHQYFLSPAGGCVCRVMPFSFRRRAPPHILPPFRDTRREDVSVASCPSAFAEGHRRTSYPRSEFLSGRMCLSRHALQLSPKGTAAHLTPVLSYSAEAELLRWRMCLSRSPSRFRERLAPHILPPRGRMCLSRLPSRFRERLAPHILPPQNLYKPSRACAENFLVIVGSYPAGHHIQFSSKFSRRASRPVKGFGRLVAAGSLAVRRVPAVLEAGEGPDLSGPLPAPEH